LKNLQSVCCKKWSRNCCVILQTKLILPWLHRDHHAQRLC